MAAKTMGGKTYTLTTVQGEKLTVEAKGRKIWLVDAMGNAAEITIGDVNQSNGVIQVINKVLLPT